MNPNDVIRIYADWLSGTLTDFAAVDQGFNAHRANVPKDGGDVIPRAVTVLDESRSLELAGGYTPAAVSTGPLLLITMPQPVELDGEVATQYRDANNFPIAIAFASTDIDTAAGITEAGLAVRTVVRSLWELHHNQNSAARRRNSTQIIACNSIRVLMVRNDPEDSTKNILGAVVLDLLVRDEAPTFS